MSATASSSCGRPKAGPPTGWPTAAGSPRAFCISQSFLRAVELGEKGISVENLSLVCCELGLSMKAFFDVPGETNPVEDGLLRQIERLTPEQRKALAAFLDTMTNQSQN